jgi:LmbE family N-acetylglucosaminyl deacetylase
MKILAIGAHPDDIEFGCGGTLSKFADTFEISMLIMTRGDRGGKTSVRWREQKRSAEILGAKLFCGGFKDTEVPMSRGVITLVEKIIRREKPDIIFVHHPSDTHQDHRNTAQAAITATRYIKNVLFYEVPTTSDFSPAAVFVDISAHIKEKLRLLDAHKSQAYATRIAELSIFDAAKATATFRGYQNRARYAEAFAPLRLSIDCFGPGNNP